MQEKLALNVKIPRLACNRLGVFFVRSSHMGTDGRRVVSQLSLGTKEPSLAKLLGLKFCIHLAKGGTLSDFRLGLSTYIVDLKNGRIEADGHEDHLRAMEAQKMAVQAQERQLEAKRLEIQLAEIRLREREVDKIMAEINPDWQINPDMDGRSSVPSPSGDDICGLMGSAPVFSKQPRKHLFPSSKPVSESAQQLSSIHKIQVPGDYILKDEMERHIIEEERRGKVDQTIGEKRPFLLIS